MFVLYNAAHENSRIRSKDKNAWIRILGFFETRESANHHAKRIGEWDTGLEIRIAPTGEFRMIMKTKYNDSPGIIDMVTRDNESLKHAELMRLHKEKRSNAFNEVSKNSEEKQMGTVEFSPKDKVNAFLDAATLISPALTTGHDLTSAVKRIPHDLEIRMQKFAAIGIIPDYLHEDILKTIVNQWEKQWEHELSTVRNSALKELLGSRDLPTNETLLREWVIQNPPPKLTNFFGQCNSPMWTKTDQPILEDADVKSWLAQARHQYGVELWKSLGIQCPEPNISEWIRANPPPSLLGAEPAVNFLSCANTEEEISNWIQGKQGIEHVDVACVAMYEWIAVGNVDKARRKYRNPMIEKLHANKELQQKECNSLRGKAKEIVIDLD
jgi:hypothetical protein